MIPSEAEDRSVFGWRRFFLAGVTAIIIILVVLSAVAAAIVMFEIDIGRIKPLVISLMSDKLGREVRIDGDLSIQLGRQIKFSAEHVVIENKGWAGSEPLFTAARLEGAVGFLSLLLDPLHLYALTADDVVIRLVAKEDETNWQFPEATDSWLDRWGDPDAPIILEALDVRNIDLSVSAPAFEQPLDIRIASIEHAVRAEQLTSRISGRINDVPLSFIGHIGPRSALRQGGPVEFGYAGELGEIEFDASGSLDAIHDPQRPAIDLSLAGPDVEYLLELLNVEAITQGPLDVRINVSREADRIDVRAAGTVGEFNVDAEGWTSDVDAFRDARLSYSAGGPNIDHVGRLFGFERLPESAFQVSGTLIKADNRLTVEATQLEIDDSVFTLSGEVADMLQFEASNLLLRARGSDIARFRKLVGVTGILDGPFDLTARLTPTAGANGRIDIDGVVDDIRSSITLFPSDETGYARSRAEFDVQGPSLEDVGRAADVQSLPPLPFRVSGRAEYRVDSIQLDDVLIGLGDSRATLSGIVDLDFPGSATNLRVAVDSPDIGSLLAAFGTDGAPSVPLQYDARMQVADNLLRITDLAAGLAEARITGTMTIGLGPSASPATFELDIDGGSFAKLLPANDWLDPADVPVTATLAGRYSAEQLKLSNTVFEVGDARIVIDGLVDRPPGFSKTDLRIDAAIPSLASLGTGRQSRLPEERAMLVGRFTGKNKSVAGQNVTLRLGANLVDIEFTYTAADVPEIRVRLASQSLDLRPFLPHPREESDVPSATPRRDRLIPEIEIPVEMLEAADIDAEFRAKRIVTHVAQYYDVELTGEVADGDLDIGHFGVRGRVGRIDGALSYRSSDGARLLDLALDGEHVSFAPLGLSLNEARRRPSYHIDVDLNSTGTTLRQLLARLDGRALLYSGGGIMPKQSSWLVNMFFSDFAMEVLDTVNPLTKPGEDISLSCAVLMLGVDDGVIAGNPAFVAQMPKLHIFARGTIDLDTEAIDIDFNTHVRKGLGMSIGNLVNPVTKIGGTLAKPTLVIDEQGVIVEAGTVLATGGLSVLAKTLHQRFLADRNPCDTALDTYRRAVESDASQ